MTVRPLTRRPSSEITADGDGNFFAVSYKGK